MSKCGLILLAAGESKRMGQPKQLLPYNGKNLLQHSIDAALASQALVQVLVLGANAAIIAPELNKGLFVCTINNEWHKGIASSICTGLNALLAAEPEIEYALFMVGDQPYISAALLDDIMEAATFTGKKIVAGSYNKIAGTPVLFHKDYFPTLLALEGDIGAKQIIKKNMSDVYLVDFLMGHIDVDTEEEYKQIAYRAHKPVMA